MESHARTDNFYGKVLLQFVHMFVINVWIICNCLSFNPQWGFCITNFSYHKNNSNERRITEENQNRHVPQRIDEIENSDGNND